MIRRFVVGTCLSILVLWAGAVAFAAPAPDAKVTEQDVQKAAKLVAERLEKLNARGAQATPVKDDEVLRALPGQVFVVVLFRQFPVAIAPPAPLASSNVFAVKDGKVQHFTAAKELEPYFRASLSPATSDSAMKDAVHAWLRLAQEFHQDGYFKFTISDDALTVSPEKDGKKASGKAVVDPQGGNKGELTATLTFDAAGRLTSVTSGGRVLAGIRPRCQATKLLDADPIIRAMAEQDILVMGRMARSYLDEQRAKATPDLQRAIDRVWQRILDEDR